MLKQSTIWYRTLTPLKQLIISFLYNWFLWFISGSVRDKVFVNENRSLLYHIVDATCMAFFVTTFFNWKKVKLIFKRDKVHRGVE